MGLLGAPDQVPGVPGNVLLHHVASVSHGLAAQPGCD
jgi:hypothetical protein